MRARHSGPNLLVEMHVVVDGNLSVHAGHDIAEEVTARLIREVKEVEGGCRAYRTGNRN